MLISIYEFGKISFPIYARNSIWKTRNVSTIHRGIYSISLIHLEIIEVTKKLFKLPVLNNGVTIKTLKLWILRNWSRQVKDAQPFLCLTIVHHKKLQLIFVIISQEIFNLHSPEMAPKMLSLPPFPKAEKTEGGNLKPTFRSGS